MKFRCRKIFEFHKFLWILADLLILDRTALCLRWTLLQMMNIKFWWTFRDFAWKIFSCIDKILLRWLRVIRKSLMVIIKNWKRMRESMENLHYLLKFLKFMKESGMFIKLSMECWRLLIWKTMMMKNKKIEERR